MCLALDTLAEKKHLLQTEHVFGQGLADESSKNPSRHELLHFLGKGMLIRTHLMLLHRLQLPLVAVGQLQLQPVATVVLLLLVVVVAILIVHFHQRLSH